MKKQMMHHIRHKEKSGRKHFLCKTMGSFYLIWLLIFLLIIGVFQVELKSSLSDFNYQYQLSLLDKGTEQMLTRVTSVLGVVNQSMYRSELDPRIALGHRTVNMVRAKKELENLVSVQNIIKECVLVSPHAQLAISSTTSYRPESFFNRIQLENMEPSDNFENLNVYFKDYPIARGTADGIPVLSFHIPFQIRFRENCYVMVIIPIDHFLQIFSESVPKNENVHSLLFFKEALLQNNGIEDPLLYSQLAQQKKIERDGHSYTQIGISKPDWGLRFVYLIDNDFYQAPVSRTMRLCFTWLIIIFILGTAIIVLFSSYKYRPIRRLHKILEDHLEPWQKEEKNEMEFIESGVDELIRRNAHLSTAISVSKRNLSNFCLFKLLHEQNLTEERAHAIIDDAGIQMDRQCFRCISITVQNFADINPFLQRMEEEKKSLSPLYLLHYLHSGTSIVLIFNFHREDTKTMSYLLDGFSDFYVQEVNISMGIGSTVDGLCNIQESFAQSQMAMHFAETKKGLPKSNYTEIELSGLVEQLYNAHHTEGLLSAIHEGDTDKISQEIEKIKDYVKQSGMPKHVIKALFYQIINEILSATQNPALYEKGNDLLMTIDETLQQYTIEDILDRIEKLCHNFVDLTSGVVLLDTVLDYIAQHYADPDFSISNMADHFKMSHQSMISMFKQEMHMTIIEYVTASRITAAKDMLLHTTLTVSDIVKKLGYIDNSSFTRKFKSVVGVTPAEYRKIHLKS